MSGEPKRPALPAPAAAPPPAELATTAEKEGVRRRRPRDEHTMRLRLRLARLHRLVCRATPGELAGSAGDRGARPRGPGGPPQARHPRTPPRRHRQGARRRRAPPCAAGAVALVRKGIRATHGTAPAKKAAVSALDQRHVLATLPSVRRGARDRALLLFGFAGGFRRSELVGLDVADLEAAGDGLRVTVRRAKTDEEGRGHTIAIRRGRHPETDPVAAVQAWIVEAGLVAGPLFRGVRNNGVVEDGRLSDRTVALVVQRAAKRIGLTPERIAGHSLRRGLATAAAEHGAPERVIMRQTGHRSERILRGYIEEGRLFQDDVGRYLPL